MTQPALVLLVKFKSALPREKIMEIANSRADEFRALRGLKQKYYMRDANSGEIAGLYFWESAEALDEYRKSELRASIAAAYEAEGEPRIEVYNIWMPLREATI